MSKNNEIPLPEMHAGADVMGHAVCLSDEVEAYGDEREAKGRSDVSEHVRRQVGRIDQWRLCMSYNDSYFGEPAGLLKSVVAELARAVDPIYPEPTPEADPLAGVTVYTGGSNGTD